MKIQTLKAWHPSVLCVGMKKQVGNVHLAWQSGAFAFCMLTSGDVL